MEGTPMGAFFFGKDREKSGGSGSGKRFGLTHRFLSRRVWIAKPCFASAEHPVFLRMFRNSLVKEE